MTRNPTTTTSGLGTTAQVWGGSSARISLIQHVGIISVHSDGTATYGEFGPVHNGYPIDKGQVTVTAFNTKLAFGSDGKPTADSTNALQKELAADKNVPGDNVRLVDFPTTDAEASNLDIFMKTANTDAEWVVGQFEI